MKKEFYDLLMNIDASLGSTIKSYQLLLQEIEDFEKNSQTEKLVARMALKDIMQNHFKNYVDLICPLSKGMHDSFVETMYICRYAGISMALYPEKESDALRLIEAKANLSQINTTATYKKVAVSIALIIFMSICFIFSCQEKAYNKKAYKQGYHTKIQKSKSPKKSFPFFR